MPSSLHVSLPDALRAFVDSRTDGTSEYATPSEYIRDLIRRDMAAQHERNYVMGELVKSMDDIAAGRLISGDELRERAAGWLVEPDDALSFYRSIT
jgi:antitoxin ParD1/3/4